MRRLVVLAVAALLWAPVATALSEREIGRSVRDRPIAVRRLGDPSTFGNSARGSWSLNGLRLNVSATYFATVAEQFTEVRMPM